MNVYLLLERGECYECSGETEILGIYADRSTAEQAQGIKQAEKTRWEYPIVEMPLIGAGIVQSQFAIGSTFTWHAVLGCDGYDREDSELAQVFPDLQFVAEDGAWQSLEEANIRPYRFGKGEIIRFQSTIVAHELRVAKNGALIEACVLKTQVMQ